MCTLDDESITTELLNVMACAYEAGTSWGRGIGWVYNIATEDVATGFRVHRQGWFSRHCTIEPAAFRGTALINLAERLLQIMRWSGGSLEMFFSHNNPLLAGGWLLLAFLQDADVHVHAPACVCHLDPEVPRGLKN